MSRKLFGTDGVRGVAGEFLTSELARALASAATRRTAARRAETSTPVRAVVVRDTRESGEMLEEAVAAGIAAAGGHVLLAGVLPTPAAPLLIARYGLDLGVVISASHNPYRDNGIKFFGGDGFKLSDEDEIAIEEALEAALDSEQVETPGEIQTLRGSEEDYLRALHERFGGLDLSGKRIALDCANGATYRVAPEIFRRLGAQVDVTCTSPDGRNINAGCGSTHLEKLTEFMKNGSYDLGFAFDGDGDRVLAVDRTGEIVDGDELIALIAMHMTQDSTLPDNGVAVTVMTNFGFHTAMESAGINVAVTPVGDRHVLAALKQRGWRLGGEQSGHVIDMNFVPSGDGIGTALLTLEALGVNDLAARRVIHRLPQKLVNVRVAASSGFESAVHLNAIVAQESQKLEGRGRVLVRASGTEPLIRIMVEAPTTDEADAACERLVSAVKQEFGSSG